MTMPPRILLVDDDPVQRRLNRFRLGHAGYDVETAADVDEALAKARACCPDAIVSDVIMGESDGFSLCRRLRADHDLRHVPVVLISARCESVADQRLAEEVGVSAFVTRTPDFARELATLRASLAKASPAAPAARPVAFAARARLSDAQFRYLLDRANDAVAVLDADDVILDVNHRWEELLACDRTAIVGRNITELAAPGYSQVNREELRQSLRAGGSPRARAAIRRPDGGVIHMELASTVVAGEPPLVFTIGRDVTEEVRAKNALRASEERYRCLIERLPDIVWSSDRDEITFISSNIAAVTGFSPEEVRALRVAGWFGRLHPEERDGVERAYERFISGRSTSYDIEYRWQHRDGRWLWLRSRASARYDVDGRVFLDGILVDVTERRRLEENLRQSHKMEAIGQLAGGVAHDFNNLLAVIMADASYLGAAFAPDDPRRVEIEEIQDAARRAAALTRQLLLFSQKRVAQPELLSVHVVIADLAKMLRRLIGEDIALSITPGEGEAKVSLDRGELEQVVINLVVNARDALPRGGAIAVQTKEVVFDSPTVTSTGTLAPGAYVELAVCDAGIGIPAGVLERIFEPFFTTKPAGRGTGLGLSTTYAIVTQAGGGISVQSELGHGATFLVCLPRRDGAAKATDGHAAAVHGGSEHVLIVEDDDLVRAAVSRILRGAGYHVVSAPNASEAMLVVEHDDRVQLVLADVVMPGGNGPELAAELRRRREGLAVLFMSGHTEHAALGRELLEDSECFLAKPFSPDALLARVRRVLERGPRSARTTSTEAHG